MPFGGNNPRDVEHGTMRKKKNRPKSNLTSFRQNEKFNKLIDVFFSQFVRFVLIGQVGLSIHIMAVLTNNTIVYVLTLAIIVILIDGFILVVKRNGREYTWFSISIFSYAAVLVISIWTLVIIKLDRPEFECLVEAPTAKEKTTDIWFLKSFDLCQLLDIMISTFLITSVVARWLLPVKRKKIKREDFSSMLIAFIINGGDIYKLVNYIEEKYILADRFFVYLILVFFTTSVVQFSFTLTTSGSKDACFRLFFGTEIWSLVFLLMIQEIPFLFIRILKLIRFRESIYDYSVYFFAVKNLVLCLFEIYRIILIYYYFMKKQKEKTSIPKPSRKRNKSIYSVEITKF